MALADALTVALRMDASQYQSEARRAAGTSSKLAGEIKGAGDKSRGAFAGVRGGVGQLSDSLGGLGKTIAGAFAVKKVGDFAKATVTSASNLAEATNAANVVFKDGAGIIDAYGKNSARSVGLAESAFKQMSATTGSLLTGLGFDTQDAANETIGLTERAADLASVFNTDVSDSLFAIQAGLRGETEPLRRFGVQLSQAEIKAKAVALGLADGTGEISKNARAQAALALIYEQSNAVAGDFANTSEGLANQQRILTAEWEDAKAEIGQALIPVFTNLVGTVRDLLPAITEILGGFAELVAAAGPLIDILGGALSWALQRVADYLGLVSKGSQALGALFGDEASKNALRYTEALEAVNDAAAEGGDATTAFANGLAHVVRGGKLTKEQLEGLGDAAGQTGERMASALVNVLAVARELGDAEEVQVLEDALWDTLLAMEKTGELAEVTDSSLGELADEFGLAEARARAMGGTVADRTNPAIEDNAELMEDAAGEAKDLAKELESVEEAQKNYHRELIAATNPTFKAVKAWQDYQEALQTANATGATAEEKLGAIEARLDAIDAFSALGDNVSEGIDAIAEAAGLSQEAVAELFEQLGFIDGAEFVAGVRVDLVGGLPQFIPEGANPVGGYSSGGAGFKVPPRVATSGTGGFTPSQHGGPRSAGQLLLVGEGGRELFVPQTAGTVLDNQLTEALLGSEGLRPRSSPLTSSSGGGAVNNHFSWEIVNPQTNDLESDLQRGLALAEIMFSVEGGTAE